MPPNCAMAMAILTPVTVSILALTNGVFKAICLVNLVAVFTSRRDLIDENRGTSNTSSYVSARGIGFKTHLLEVPVLIIDTDDNLVVPTVCHYHTLSIKPAKS